MEIKVGVEVTSEDIKRGKQGQTGSCPIARALRRTMTAGLNGSVKSVCVEQYGVSVKIGDTTYYHRGPMYRLGNFIDRFDRDRNSVRPTEFKLSLTPSY